MNTSSKKGHRVAVVGGDGIGPEVVAEALKVIDAAGVKLDLTSFDLGGARYLRDGEVLSDKRSISFASLMQFCWAQSAPPMCRLVLSNAGCC